MKKIVLMSLMASLPFTVISQAHAANTQEFVQKASMAGEFEIQSSKVALDKSTSSDVKDFAQGMITDHTDGFKKT